MKVNSPLQVYKYLPGTNCGECESGTCMAFAANLIERTASPEDCTPMIEEDKYKDKFVELVEVVSPEVAAVTIGVGDEAVEIGGEDVMHRHELTFYNMPAFAYDVSDTMSEDEVVERVKHVDTWRKFYVGKWMNVEMLAVRGVSGDPGKFEKCVATVAENTEKPLVLCSFDPDVLRAGLEAVGDRNPLIYAATEDNWQEVADLVEEYDCPVTLFAPGDLDKLTSLAMTFQEMGFEDLVLDPGTYPQGDQLKRSFENFVKLRRAVIEDENKDVAFPVMSTPFTAWLVHEDEVTASYWETVLASMFIVRYGDIMILHSTEPYSMLPLTHLRYNIYTDPRTPVQVDPGVQEVGEPDESSPVIVTTNFALTYYTVESDLDSNDIDSYVIVVDTEGIGVEAAVAGGQLTTDRVVDTLKDVDFDVEARTNHGTLILPGLAARLQGDLEVSTGLNVMVGPQDSGQIPKWMDKNWPPE